MKLFLLAALIAVSSAARLEHLEQQRGLREYLPPVQGHGQFGQSGFSHPGSHGSNFASQGSNSLDAGDSAGFGSAPQGLKAGAGGVRGFSSFDAARSNQYLPPDHGPSGSSGFNKPSGGRGQDSFGASSNQFGSASQFGPSHGFGTHGSSSFGSQGSNALGSQGSSGAHGPQGFGSHGSGFGSQGSSGFGSHGSSFGPQGSNGFGSHGSHGSGFGSQGSGFGSQGSGFGSQGSGFGSQGSGFGSQGSSFGSQGSRQQLRQYLAPKASSSHDNIPQQAFDEEKGYIY